MQQHSFRSEATCAQNSRWEASRTGRKGPGPAGLCCPLPSAPRLVLDRLPLSLSLDVLRFGRVAQHSLSRHTGGPGHPNRWVSCVPLMAGYAPRTKALLAMHGGAAEPFPHGDQEVCD